MLLRSLSARQCLLYSADVMVSALPFRRGRLALPFAERYPLLPLFSSSVLAPLHGM